MNNDIYFFVYIILGDVREALRHVKKYVLSESAFFNAFLEEGLRFSSSLYLCFIWIRVLKHVLENPNEATENLQNQPFFKKFVSKPITDTNIDGLCSSLKCICEKRRLSEILPEDNSSDEENVSKRSRTAWDTSSEESAPESPALYMAKSPKKKDIKKQKKNKEQ